MKIKDIIFPILFFLSGLILGISIIKFPAVVNRVPEVKISLTPSPIPTPIIVFRWKTYRDSTLGFSFEYPDYFAFKKSQEADLDPTKLRDNPYEEPPDAITVTVIKNSLENIPLKHSDGISPATFAFNRSKDSWEHARDNYVGADDQSIPSRTPLHYLTRSNLTSWIVPWQRNYMSTMGGNNWQMVFIEHPQKKFTLILTLWRCTGVYCSATTRDHQDIRNDRETTIHKILQTLQFE